MKFLGKADALEARWRPHAASILLRRAGRRQLCAGSRCSVSGVRRTHSELLLSDQLRSCAPPGRRGVCPHVVRLEAETCLQLEFAIGSCARKGTARERDGLPEEWRAQGADGSREIRVVQHIARIQAQRKVVAAIRGAGTEDRPHAGSRSAETTTATTGATSMPTAVAAAWATASC